MKCILCYLLAIMMVLSLFTGCGEGTDVENTMVTTAVTEAAPTQESVEPITEPTLSPEEIQYNALSERMKSAVDLGLVTLTDLENSDRVVTVGEAAAMLQKAYIHRAGVESKTLIELADTPEFAERNATRGWIVNVPGLADMELVFGEEYESYEKWIKRFNKGDGDYLWWSYRERLNFTSFAVVTSDDRIVNASGDLIVDRPGIENAQDLDLCLELMKSDLLYGPGEKDNRFLDIGCYALQIYDQTNGKKFFEFEDGCVNPEKEITVAELAEYALVYYNYPNPMDYPDFVAPEDVGTYNTEIITRDLLAKETDLPEASCQNLPASWHGVVMDDFQFTWEYNMHPDFEVYEYEILQVKEAGFNFIGLNLDFSWLQDNALNDKQRDPYVGFVKDEDVGKFSLERLEKLDQVIAWCMKYDIHVNLRATALGGMNDSTNMYSELDRNSNKHADTLAAMWQAIARRYADIPNTYLSFTLFTGDYPLKNHLLIPSVESIREVSPERCIIADICGWDMESEEFAKLGVALSFRLFDLEKYDAILNFDYLDRTWTVSAKGRSIIENFEWPYKEKVDAQVLFTHERYSKQKSLIQVAETAKEYGVGFMLSDFGVSYNGSWWFSYPRARYADEAYFAMITDIVSTIEEMGYGWCFAQWYGPFGLAFYLPVNTASTYVQIEDYNYYIDQAMLELFRELNHVA